jgi:cysteinyl-tRNA synthetase
MFSVVNATRPAEINEAQAGALLDGLAFMTQALGLQLPEAQAQAPAQQAPAEILALAQQRWEAKAARDWPLADRLRQEVEAQGWVIKDHKTGFEVQPK